MGRGAGRRGRARAGRPEEGRGCPTDRAASSAALAGTTSFWCALSAGDGDEWAKLGYAAVNAAMLALSVVVGRRVLAVFGGLGLAGWLGHLSLKVFGDVAAFPLVTLVIGAAVAGLGLKWPAIEARFARRRAG